MTGQDCSVALSFLERSKITCSCVYQMSSEELFFLGAKAAQDQLQVRCVALPCLATIVSYIKCSNLIYSTIYNYIYIIILYTPLYH